MTVEVMTVTDITSDIFYVGIILIVATAVFWSVMLWWHEQGKL